MKEFKLSTRNIDTFEELLFLAFVKKDIREFEKAIREYFGKLIGEKENVSIKLMCSNLILKAHISNNDDSISLYYSSADETGCNVFPVVETSDSLNYYNISDDVAYNKILTPIATRMIYEETDDIADKEYIILNIIKYMLCELYTFRKTTIDDYVIEVLKDVENVEIENVIIELQLLDDLGAGNRIHISFKTHHGGDRYESIENVFTSDCVCDRFVNEKFDSKYFDMVSLIARKLHDNLSNKIKPVADPNAPICVIDYKEKGL